MCGIIGYVGSRKAAPILLEGLKKLEYRGYDSAGFCTITNSKVMVEKDIGKIEEVEKPEFEYDISVPGIENFCGGVGGIILHNSGHCDRNQLINFVYRLSPKPKRIIVNHGEASRCLDLSSTLHKLNNIETMAPRNLETIRVR